MTVRGRNRSAGERKRISSVKSAAPGTGRGPWLLISTSVMTLVAVIVGKCGKSGSTTEKPEAMAGDPVMILFCRVCDSPNPFMRRWIEDHDACSTCGAEGQWRTVNEPRVAYELSLNDKRLLKSLRIASE